jgi:hypothetical protein
MLPYLSEHFIILLRYINHDTHLSASAFTPSALSYLESVYPSEHPLQVSIRHTWLELWLHVSALVRLRPHQTALKVLDSHDPLRAIPSHRTVLSEQGLVLEIRLGNVDGCCGLRCEAQSSTNSQC